MQIRSQGVCIANGDVIRVECENNRRRIQQRYYYIERKAVLDHGAEYLAQRLKRDENGRFSLFVAVNHIDPSEPVLLSQRTDSDSRNQVVEKINNPGLSVQDIKNIRKIVGQSQVAAKFADVHKDDGVKIKGRDYGRLLISASEDRRDREFLEGVGHMPWMKTASPEGALGCAKLGDVMRSAAGFNEHGHIESSAEHHPHPFEM